MKITRAVWVVTGGFLVMIPLLMAAQDRSQRESNSSGVMPDNSAMNKYEQRDSGVTSEDQGQSPQDMDVTRQIRRAVLDDESLSTYAHNVKIIVRNGLVTLRGPVRSAEEKAAVEVKAASIVGKENVKNEIGVSSKGGK